MTLGAVTLPTGTRIKPTIKTLEIRNRTASGTLKRDISAQKSFITLQFPMTTNTVFDGIKALKEAQANVSFVYPDESGSGNLTITVALDDLKYVRRLEYPDGSMYIDGFSLTMEEV